MVEDIKKFDYIDSVRAVAILMVLLVHTLTFLDRGNLNSLFRIIVEQGRMGVQLFYMASAFTLFYSLTQRSVFHKIERFPKLSFFLRRYFRIVPMFYVAIGYYLWQYISFPDSSVEAANLATFTMWNIFSHITLTHGINPYWINTIVPGGWSVAVECIFYVIVPVLYMAYIKFGKNFLSLALLLTLSISWIFNFGAFFILNESLPTYWHAFLYYNFFTQLPVFILGIVVYDYMRSDKKSLRYLHTIFCISGILFVMSLFLNRITSEGVFAGSMLFLSVILAYFIIFIEQYKPRILVNKIFSHIGKISYSMYLVHFAIIALMAHLTKSYTYPSNELTFGLSFLVLVVITIAVSSVTYAYIERPFMRMGATLIKKLNS